MARGYIMGGEGIATLYTIASNAFATVIHGFKFTISSTMSRAEGGIWTITLENEEDSEELQAVYDTLLDDASGGVVEPERTYENGDTVGGGSAGNLVSGLVIVGGVEQKGAGTKRKLWAGPVSMDPSSSSYGQKFNEPTKPTVVFKSNPQLVDIDVPASILNAIVARDGTTLLFEAADPADDITIEFDDNAAKGGKPYYITKYTP